MGYERQADFGTPEVRSDTSVSLTIDGRDVTVPAGTSVMRAASLCGGSIPSLCATDSLEAFGSCRMCLVEVDGMRGLPTFYQSHHLKFELQRVFAWRLSINSPSHFGFSNL